MDNLYAVKCICRTSLQFVWWGNWSRLGLTAPNTGQSWPLLTEAMQTLLPEPVHQHSLKRFSPRFEILCCTVCAILNWASFYFWNWEKYTSSLLSVFFFFPHLRNRVNWQKQNSSLPGMTWLVNCMNHLFSTCSSLHPEANQFLYSCVFFQKNINLLLDDLKELYVPETSKAHCKEKQALLLTKVFYVGVNGRVVLH